MNDMLSYDFSHKLNEYLDVAVDFVPKLLFAGVVFFIGTRLLRYLCSLTKRALEKTSLDLELKSFVESVVSVALKVLLLFMVAGIIGIETTKFVAVFGAAVFAVGMALQGSLGHFAAGLLILIFRPYRIGHVVEIQGQRGTVMGINMINTVIELFDGRSAIIPNGTAISDIVINYSDTGAIRVDTSVSMPYSEDFPKVHDIVLAAVTNTPGVLKDPKPFVGIGSFDSHNIVLNIWPHANPEDYWDVLFNVNKNVKKALGENHIQMAYSEGVELGSIGK